jgi:diacylglycerol kinase (ATP)
MKLGMLLHNPTAGDAEHSKKALSKLLEDHGFLCRYLSVKDDWKDFSPDIDFIVIAGGDGTVRKVLKGLDEKERSLSKWPLALLPLGTANNIARTLRIGGNDAEIVESWHNQLIKHTDLGRIQHKDEQLFFVEGIGCGLFASHMKDAKEIPENEEESPEDKMKADLKIFYDKVFTARALKCNLVIDQKDYSGQYIMVEIMNIQSVGTRLLLAPNADPGDGFFDVVLIPEKDREHLASYLYDRIRNEDKIPDFKIIRGQTISFSCEEGVFHVDDKSFNTKPGEKLDISLEQGVLKFLVPDGEKPTTS